MPDMARPGDERAWVNEVWAKLAPKMAFAREAAGDLPFIPYTTDDGAWKSGPVDGICWWTNGFWPAAMWQMYLATGDAAYRREAERAESMLDEAFVDFDHLHHDVGFLWHISAGVNFRLTGNDLSRRRVLHAAALLAGRFNPGGFIRAWNGDCTGWAIIDCMLNIQLLFWAGDFTGDPRFRKIAMAHADTTMRHFVREDGSVNHIVKFDPETMEVLEKPAGQGCAVGSSWSRGQAWAMYGFALSHIHTGKPEYLETARRVARYFIDQMGEDWIPRCDFRQPPEPDLRDNCAGAIAACALIELSKLGDGVEERRFYDAAVRLLRVMDEKSADWSPATPAILTQCTGAYSSTSDRHVTMIYADYFFIEAMAKLRGETPRFW